MGPVLADGPETRGRRRPALSVAREIPRSECLPVAAPTHLYKVGLGSGGDTR
jgi:hypothetical protein